MLIFAAMSRTIDNIKHIKWKQRRTEEYKSICNEQWFIKFRQYANRAYKKGITFYLTPQDFKSLNHSKCEYCGKKPSGFDRVDNKLGYERANVVPCCGRCNLMKHTMAIDEFKEHIILIYNNIDTWK